MGTAGDVCASPFDKRDARTYYVLKPLDGPSASVIYTPVDNERVPMRALLTLEEAETFLRGLASVPCLPIPSEKGRRDAYRAAIVTGRPESYLAVIKAIGGRRTAFHGTQRRLPEFEIEYEGIARRYLYTELSIVLGRPFEEMEAYVTGRLEESLAI